VKVALRRPLASTTLAVKAPTLPEILPVEIERIAALELAIAALDTKLDSILAVLQPVARDVDPADRRLWEICFDRIGPPHEFSAAELVEHAKLHVDLHDALRNADIVNIRQCGKWLRRLSRCQMGGVRLVRVREETRIGAIWQFQVSQE
jgi:hypothetical protein